MGEGLTLGLQTYLAFSPGYVFSLFVGHFALVSVLDGLHARMGIAETSLWYPASARRVLDGAARHWRRKGGEGWHPAALGYVERTLYTLSWHVGAPQFIVVWLGLKTAVQWHRWQQAGGQLPGRHVYNVFLVGSALSLLYASGGAAVAQLVLDNMVLRAAAIVVVLPLATWGLKAWADHSEVV